MLTPDWSKFTPEDMSIVMGVIGTEQGPRKPDLVIAPDGNPYLFRWHILRSPGSCVYFHIQIADDPERPLHDHPWDNMSVILSGGFTEIIQTHPTVSAIHEFSRKKGDVIFRKATAAHRLLMPTSGSYTMTQFTTGPKLRNWGFWYPHGWVPHQEVSELLPDGRSVHKPGTDARRQS
jgi:hypothetical protein